MNDVLPKDHYLIRIYRGQFPQRVTLLTQFSEVAHLVEGFRWMPHDSRLNRNHEPSEDVVLYLHDFGQDVGVEEVVAWGLANGYLVADMKEAHAFGTDPQTCELQREFSIVAMGSSPRCMELGPFYAVLSCEDNKRTFKTFSFDRHSSKPSNLRFLYVRK